MDGHVAVDRPYAYLDKAVVEREAVSNGVLPAHVILLVEREVRRDELVDLAQRAHLLRRPLDRHCDQRDVGERRLGVGVVASESGGRLVIHK